MKALGYIRLSTDKQADEGVPLAAQRTKVRAMAQLHDSELVDLIVDAGESAKSMKRPGLRRLLGLVEAGEVDAVIVAKG